MKENVVSKVFSSFRCAGEAEYPVITFFLSTFFFFKQKKIGEIIGFESVALFFRMKNCIFSNNAVFFPPERNFGRSRATPGKEQTKALSSLSDERGWRQKKKKKRLPFLGKEDFKGEREVFKFHERLKGAT